MLNVRNCTVGLHTPYSVIASNINFITDLANKENDQKLNQKLNRKNEE